MSMIHLLSGHTPNPIVLTDNMDWADATAATNAGWTNVSTPTWGYATAPAPIAGYSGNLRVTSASIQTFSPIFTVGGTAWFYFQIIPQTLTNEATVALLTDASNASIGVAISFRTTGAIRITSTTTTDSSAGTIVAGTLYHIMIGVIVGTGNADITVYASTTGTWGAAAAHKVNGTTTANPARIRFAGATSTQEIIAKLRVSQVIFGDNPA